MAHFHYISFNRKFRLRSDLPSSAWINLSLNWLLAKLKIMNKFLPKNNFNSKFSHTLIVSFTAATFPHIAFLHNLPTRYASDPLRIVYIRITEILSAKQYNCICTQFKNAYSSFRMLSLMHFIYKILPKESIACLLCHKTPASFTLQSGVPTF